MFIMDNADVEKLVKMLTNYSVGEIQHMIDEYRAMKGRRPTHILCPRASILGLKLDFYDGRQAALYAPMKKGEMDA